MREVPSDPRMPGVRLPPARRDVRVTCACVGTGGGEAQLNVRACVQHGLFVDFPSLRQSALAEQYVRLLLATVACGPLRHLVLWPLGNADEL